MNFTENKGRILPTKDSELNEWLDNFTREFSSLKQEFGIDDSELSHLNHLISQMKREIRKSEIGIEMDYVYKGLVKNELHHNLKQVITNIESSPSYTRKHYAKKLKLK
ncbi:hypothetical protein RCC89_16845 [Cytophagaceae bacterium ABcell3]|nr:hypothetical protein RCC89_16845 [Cytophagaceae bacterium ABcell3]